MTIWRMRIACWTPKAPNTHSDYVTHILFHCKSIARTHVLRILDCLVSVTIIVFLIARGILGNAQVILYIKFACICSVFVLCICWSCAQHKKSWAGPFYWAERLKQWTHVWYHSHISLLSMDRSWKHSSLQRALGTDDTAGWRVFQVNTRPWLCWAVNRQNTGITKVLLWTGLEALWARGTAVMVGALVGRTVKVRKRGTICR
jgi:hypothetical protein